MSKNLVAYFSASGITARKAEELAKLAVADLFEIEPLQPYSDADLDWTNSNSRSTVEMKDESCRPAIKSVPDLSGYDTIYLGFPIWWGVAPRPVDTFLDQADLKGKKIELFATSGGSGIRAAVHTMKGEYPDLDIEGGKLLNGPLTTDLL